MMPIRPLYAALLLPLALTACKKAATEKTAQAGGEVLPGSASDAMLPMDTVTSQPPLAPKTMPLPGSRKDAATDGAAAAAAPADTPAEKAPAEPAPDQAH